jgi:hypothetical protein
MRARLLLLTLALTGAVHAAHAQAPLDDNLRREIERNERGAT